MDREEIKKIIQEHVMTSAEVIDFLDISRPTLASLVKRGKLVPVKDGATRLFFKQDVEARKSESEELREKFRPYE